LISGWYSGAGYGRPRSSTAIVTIAKVVPIVVFVILALVYLNPQVFPDNWST
jgi:hypothetical protein